MITIKAKCPTCEHEMTHLHDGDNPVFTTDGCPLVNCNCCKSIFVITNVTCSMVVLIEGELNLPDWEGEQ